MNKEDYYYKTSDFIYLDNKEKMKHELNEYGYNLDSTKRRVVDQNNLLLKSKTFTNKDFFTNRK
jgi:hypothetical protein